MEILKLLDPKGVNTRMYDLTNLDKELEMIKFKEVKNEDETTLKEFNMQNSIKEILILSILKDRTIVNVGYYEKQRFNISKCPKGIRYAEITCDNTEEEVIFKNTKDRRIYIFDLETAKKITGNIVKKDEDETTYIYNIVPGKKYLAIELRFGKRRIIATGACKFEKEQGKFIADIEANETNRIDIDMLFEEIQKGNSKELNIEEYKGER